MRIHRVAASIVPALLLISLHADELLPPLHPTLLLAEYRGNSHPVIAVEKGQPVVMLDGRRRVLKGNIPLSTERLARFGDAHAEITDLKSNSLVLLDGFDRHNIQEAAERPRGTLAGFAEFTATITADRALSNCFVAWFAYDKGFTDGETDQPDAQIRIKEIDDLRANEPTQIKVTTAPFLGFVQRRTFVLLFSEGKEVATSGSIFPAYYFRARERVVHAAAVQKWLKMHSKSNRPAEPFLQIPPIVDSGEELPSEVSVRIAIGADGLVSGANVDPGLQANVESAILRAFHAWLFLPKIEDGVPVATQASIPLRF